MENIMFHKDNKLEFIDILNFFKETPVYDIFVYEELVANTGIYNNYYIWDNLKDVLSPRKEYLNPKRFSIILALDINDKRVGMLMFLWRNMAMVRGLWPIEFAENVEKNPNKLNNTFRLFLREPSLWRMLFIIKHQKSKRNKNLMDLP